MTVVGWLWIIFAAAFALAGLILMLRALFLDRSRGRKRCPKCWYDMTGATSLRCTECGREAKSERRLYRTRRHSRAALLGVLLVLAGIGLYAGGEVHREGWVRATPTVAYIAALPWLDQNTTLGELTNRINRGELRQWEYRLLVQRCLGILRSSDDPEENLRPLRLIFAVDTAYRSSHRNHPWARWHSIFADDGHGVMDEMSRLLNHRDPGIRGAVLDGFRRTSRSSARMLPAILARCNDEDFKIRQSARKLLPFFGSAFDGVRFQAGMTAIAPLQQLDREQGSVTQTAFGTFCNDLASCGPDFERATTVLKAGLHSQHPVLQSLSTYALTGCLPSDPYVRDELLRQFDSANYSVRQSALAATPAFPLDDRVRKIIHWGLQQAGTEGMALRVIGARGRAAEEFGPDLQKRFSSPSDGHFEAAVDAYCRVGGDPTVAVDACLDRLHRSVRAQVSGQQLAQQIDILARLGAESPKACAVLESWFRTPDKSVRSAAARAYAVLGGQDLDTATRIILDAAATDRSPGEIDRARAMFFARHGRISVPVMAEELSAVDPARRANAAQMLGESWHAGIPALTKLQEMRNDTDPNVQASIIESINRIEWARDHPDWQPPE